MEELQAVWTQQCAFLQATVAFLPSRGTLHPNGCVFARGSWRCFSFLLLDHEERWGRPSISVSSYQWAQANQGVFVRLCVGLRRFDLHFFSLFFFADSLYVTLLLEVLDVLWLRSIIPRLVPLHWVNSHIWVPGTALPKTHTPTPDPCMLLCLVLLGITHNK